MDGYDRKHIGAYYTPEAVVRSLVHWAVRRASDRMLDPACGDGRFLAVHRNSIGVEQDPRAAQSTHFIAPGSEVHQADFFSWAAQARERFECAAGNPPFIRYQRFNGQVRKTALALCAKHGVRLSALTSSWAPFLVATASLLKPGGRMAFVVPAEVGHAPYAKPVLEYLAAHFRRVQIVAVRHKIFPELSEDCWLLYADGFGGSADCLLLSPMDQFGYMPEPPTVNVQVRLEEWRKWNGRLRTFLLSEDVRRLYAKLAADTRSMRLQQVGKVGIGYVTGDNGFFHLRPSQAARAGIPEPFLHPSVRNSRALTGRAITQSKVEAWRRRDEPNFLLRIRPTDRLPASVRRYLDSEQAWEARKAYKCRNRDPWYVVPHVVFPDAFLGYMSSEGPALVANRARCTGSNSVHMVTLGGAMKVRELLVSWRQPLTRLSCEIEGHPLGGGMLKLEPREAGQVVLRRQDPDPPGDRAVIREGIATMRKWRHCG